MGLKFSFEYKINGVQKSSCSEINDDFILETIAESVYHMKFLWIYTPRYFYNTFCFIQFFADFFKFSQLP